MSAGVTWSADGSLLSIGQPHWLARPELQLLMNEFEHAGFQIYAVGGCVRDTVLCKVVADVDLSTDATPDQVSTLINGIGAEHGKWRAIPTGIDHGTITAVGQAGTFEITTFRTDVETDGRHATVAFSKDIHDDAERRDFTINAFYADRRGTVRDIVGGSADLAARHVRFIGDPAARITEDYLRILRFFRFTASHSNRDLGIDVDGLAACAEHADGLTGVSRERIGAEMTRLMFVDDVAPIIGSMEISGVLNRILPGAGVQTLARLIDIEHQHPNRDDVATRDVATRLSALGCEDTADRLKLSKAYARKIDVVREIAGSMMPPHELGYRYGYWTGMHGLMLRWASLQRPYDAKARAAVDHGADVECPVKAKHLMDRYSGKALGDRLKELESAWIASGFLLTEQELLAL